MIWIFMENHGYGQIIGNSAAPFLNSLAATCGLVTDYHNVTHPSLPNYLSATSGLELEQGSDCLPTACPQQAKSLFAQVAASGREWRAYEESMSANCQKSDGGGYIAHHNPAAYYTPLAAQCAKWDVRMGSASGGNFLNALKNNSLPAFSFVTPSQCHVMGSCGIGAGDSWLASWFGVIANSAAYKAGHTAIFVTFDEGGTPHHSANCVTASTADCHVATWVVAPSVPHGRRSSTGTEYTHYSLLLTTEQMLGIAAHLGNAAHAVSLRSPFKL
ncbi:MAG: alkaline phosphatase family protein [Micromonosporaceae bacterium]